MDSKETTGAFIHPRDCFRVLQSGSGQRTGPRSLPGTGRPDAHSLRSGVEPRDPRRLPRPRALTAQLTVKTARIPGTGKHKSRSLNLQDLLAHGGPRKATSVPFPGSGLLGGPHGGWSGRAERVLPRYGGPGRLAGSPVLRW